jgi:hypothetical protein
MSAFYHTVTDLLKEFIGSASVITNDTTDKELVQSDMSKPALIFFSLQEYTPQNPLSKF